MIKANCEIKAPIEIVVHVEHWSGCFGAHAILENTRTDLSAADLDQLSKSHPWLPTFLGDQKPRRTSEIRKLSDDSFHKHPYIFQNCFPKVIDRREDPRDEPLGVFAVIDGNPLIINLEKKAGRQIGPDEAPSFKMNPYHALVFKFTIDRETGYEVEIEFSKRPTGLMGFKIFPIDSNPGSPIWTELIAYHLS